MTGASRRLYFYLSYAPSAPSSDDDVRVVDEWAKEFFDDLSRALASVTGLSETGLGFIDQNIPIDADWTEASRGALASANVFVPLYSPNYFARAATLREREIFRNRLLRLEIEGLDRYTVPVLWTPLTEPSTQDGAFDDLEKAAELGQDTPEYAENGVRALCLLKLFRPQYERIVERLAGQIATIVHTHPLDPSFVPEIADVAVPAHVEAQFVVAVIAPSGTDIPAGRNYGRYGPQGKLWRPFAGHQAMPIAQYAASTAERLGSLTLVEEFKKVHELMSKRPTVVLIDPWIILTANGRQSLVQATQELSTWAAPVFVTDGDDPDTRDESAKLVAEARMVMESAGVPNVQHVSELQEFVDILPRLISQARNQFLRESPVYTPPGNWTERPRIIGGSDHD